MSKFVLLFISLAIFQIASALQCYKCDNCKGTSSSWEKTLCGSTPISIPQGKEWACSTIKYKDRKTYADAEKRSCVLADKINGKLSFGCPTADGEPTSCPVCQADLCNSATTIKFSILGFACIALAVFLPKYL